jgi:hypothetical protein
MKHVISQSASGFICALLVCALVCIPMTGCTVSQSKIDTVVTDIGNVSAIVSADAGTLSTEITAFNPSDAGQIEGDVAVIVKDSAALSVLCKQYVAIPSASLLTQISTLVGTLATSDSAALLSVLQIKDANSQATAKAALTALATALTIISTYLGSVHVAATPATAAALNNLKPFLDHVALQRELDLAKSQGVAPQWVTLQYLGF